MKSTATSETYLAIMDWYRNEGSIDQIAHHLGDRHGKLRAMLLDCKLSAHNGMANHDYSLQEIVDMILLYLAMRRG